MFQSIELLTKVRSSVAGWQNRDCSCRNAMANAQWFQCKLSPPRMPRTLRPNPSLKRSPNGGPPGPGWWYAVHFHQPGPGVPPLGPA